MARPRVFISSTFYDLKHIRNDIEGFVRELGYEPVLHERGAVPYGKADAIEKYCYKEISNCEILIHIVGSRFGSQALDEGYSVSQVELRTAHKLNRQIYIFIEKGVFYEYRTYLRNEGVSNFCPQFVDDVRIYKFIKELYALPTNNAVFDFESARDITEKLREQWAGLFQRFLQQESRLDESRISANLKATADTLAKMVEYVTRERDETIKAILVQGHPVFSQLAERTSIRIRILFFSVAELVAFLETFGYRRLEDDFALLVFSKTDSNDIWTLKIDSTIFDENENLLPPDPKNWNSNIVSIERTENPDDDVPF